VRAKRAPLWRQTDLGRRSLGMELSSLGLLRAFRTMAFGLSMKVYCPGSRGLTFGIAAGIWEGRGGGFRKG
jgi:hypothetical protein